MSSTVGTFSSASPRVQRANAAVREPEIQSFWDKEGIYDQLSASNQGEKYVLHDGPPYANGDLHIGHALNKARMSGAFRFWPHHLPNHGQGQHRVVLTRRVKVRR